MKCPKCDSQMTGVVADGGRVVERCDGCGGLFVSRVALDRLERNWLFDRKSSSDDLDTGDPNVGRKYDRLREIDCPVCSVKMNQISDFHQPHIWLEECPSCHGVFFDAGELTDLRYETFADWIRDFLKRPRKE